MALGLAGYIMKEETNNYLREKLPNTMMKYNTSADIHLAWDTLQSTVCISYVMTFKLSTSILTMTFQLFDRSNFSIFLNIVSVLWSKRC